MLHERSAWFWFTVITFPPKGSTGSFTFWTHYGNKGGKLLENRGAGARTPRLKLRRGGGEAPGERPQPKDCPYPRQLWVAPWGPSCALLALPPKVLFHHPDTSSCPPAPLHPSAGLQQEADRFPARRITGIRGSKFFSCY